MIEPWTIDGLPRRTTGFDFLVGSWQVDNERLREPLSGRQEWYSTPAEAWSTTLHNGAMSVDEMWYPDEGFAGTSIRLHDPSNDTWTIYWVNSSTGRLQPPVAGRWAPDGSRFVADGPDEFAGRPVLARYMWHSITATSATWEQAFSIDEGATWETNWVMRWSRTVADR